MRILQTSMSPRISKLSQRRAWGILQESPFLCKNQTPCTPFHRHSTDSVQSVMTRSRCLARCQVVYSADTVQAASFEVHFRVDCININTIFIRSSLNPATHTVMSRGVQTLQLPIVIVHSTPLLQLHLYAVVLTGTAHCRNLGDVSTNHHAVSLRVKSLLDSCNEGLDEHDNSDQSSTHADDEDEAGSVMQVCSPLCATQQFANAVVSHRMHDRIHEGASVHLCLQLSSAAAAAGGLCVCQMRSVSVQNSSGVSKTLVHLDVALQNGETSERANGHLSKDPESAVKAAPQEADGEADMDFGMDGDVASIKTKPAETEPVLPTNKQAEQTSPVKPIPKERLAGESFSHHNDCLQRLLSAAWGPSHTSASICQLHHLCCHHCDTH